MLGKVIFLIVAVLALSSPSPAVEVTSAALPAIADGGFEWDDAPKVGG